MKFWFVPFINLSKLVGDNGYHLSRFGNIFPWFIKFFLLEPFRLYEAIKKDAEIRNHSIEVDPIFILGFYRSGTTYLQRLILQDNRFGYQTVLDTAYPELMLGGHWLIMPILDIWKRIFRPQNKFQRIPLEWEQPGEEDLAMLSAGWKESVTWGYLFPSAFEKYFKRYALFEDGKETQDVWLQKYLYWIKKLSIKNRNRQLLLKNPPNMARIPLLLELFPNAKFIFIYRDPEHVFASNHYLWKVTGENYAFQKIGNKRIEELILYSYRLLTKKYLEDRNLIPSGQLFELRYENLVADPVAHLHALYRSLQITDFESVIPEIKKSLSSFTKYRQVNYSLSEKDCRMVNQNWKSLYEKI